MPDIWAGIRSKIDDLETLRAPASTWSQVADEETPVVSDKQLTGILQLASFSQPEVLAAQSTFNRCAKTVLFGFEGNYHALVFFQSAGVAHSVIKW